MNITTKKNLPISIGIIVIALIVFALFWGGHDVLKDGRQYDKENITEDASQRTSEEADTPSEPERLTLTVDTKKEYSQEFLSKLPMQEYVGESFGDFVLSEISYWPMNTYDLEHSIFPKIQNLQNEGVYYSHWPADANPAYVILDVAFTGKVVLHGEFVDLSDMCSSREFLIDEDDFSKLPPKIYQFGLRTPPPLQDRHWSCLHIENPELVENKAEPFRGIVEVTDILQTGIEGGPTGFQRPRVFRILEIEG